MVTHQDQNQDQSTYKIKILRALAEYKFLTAKQIWDKTGAALAGVSFNQIQVEIQRLKRAGLVRLEVVKGEKGGSGQHHWLLLRAGARLIEFKKFDNHYLRDLTREQTDYHKLEIDLEEQVALALGNWRLVKRQPVSSTRPLPETTEQASVLCQVLTWQEGQKTGQLPARIIGPHTLMVPLKANQPVAYTEGYTQAVIFILPRPRATERFWQSRKKDYGRLRDKVGIYGVFPNKSELVTARRVLEKNGFAGVTIGQVSGLLDQIAL